VGAWLTGFHGLPDCVAALCLILQRDCLTKCSNTLWFLTLIFTKSLRVLFITAMTLALNNDDGSNWEWSCYVLVCVKYAIWLVLSSTYHFLTNDSLQSTYKDQQESRAMAGKPHVRCRYKMRYSSKFYSGIARFSIVRLSCLFLYNYFSRPIEYCTYRWFFINFIS